MIALFLAAQLSAQPLIGQNSQLFRAPQPRSSEIIQALPRKSVCAADPGRLEVSLAQPAALYRKGDRPATGRKNWIDYPDGALCLVGGGR